MKPPRRGVLDHLIPPVAGGAAGPSPDGQKAQVKAARAHFAAGRLAESERLCRQLLAQDPAMGDALDLLGLLAFRAGRLDQALTLIERAVARQARSPLFHTHRGIMLGASGRLGEAVEAFRAALAHGPGFAEAHYNLGLALAKMGDGDGAVAAFRQAVKHEPRHLWAHNNLGTALMAKGALEAAETSFRRALDVDPRFVEGYENLATVLHDQGRTRDAARIAERGLGVKETAALHYAIGRVREAEQRLEDAARSYRRALELEPDLVPAGVNLGNVLRELERDEESWALNKRFVGLHPDSPGILNNYALALLAGTKSRTPPAAPEELLDQAMIAIRKAVDLSPGTSEFRLTQALVLSEAGRDEETLRTVEPLLAHHSNMESARFLEKISRLRLGNDDAGCDAFRWYWRLPDKKKDARPFRQPLWEGQAIPAGQKLLVWADHGVGDEIIYSSFIPELARTGARVVLECDIRLVDIFRRSYPEIEVHARMTPPDPALAATDLGFQCPLSQLMAWLGPWPDGFPRQRRYLVADPARVGAFGTALESADKGKLKVGISWRSRRSARALERVRKAIEILDWEPILRQPGIQFVNLQYDDAADDIADVRDKLGVAIHTVPGLDRLNDIEGMMALVASLDCVVTISNVSAHFAGAVGTDCRVLAHKAPFWYWRRHGERAAIYESVRILRQAESGQWGSVVAAAAAALGSKLAQTRERGPCRRHHANPTTEPRDRDDPDLHRL